MHRRLMVILLPLLASCARTAPDAATARQELMDADRAFAATTDSLRLNGWMSVYAGDAVRMRLGGPAVQGLDSIRAFDAPIFADSAARLRWEPAASGVFEDGNHGYTTGRSVMIKPKAGGGTDTLYAGRYVTIWRRDAAGKWKVILDTGA